MKYIVGILSLLFIFSCMAEEKPNKIDYIGLDVRTAGELKENPAPGAKHIGMNDLTQEALKDIPKDQPIKVFCEAGGRAGRAAKKLKSWGYTKAENIGSFPAVWRQGDA